MKWRSSWLRLALIMILNLVLLVGVAGLSPVYMDGPSNPVRDLPASPVTPGQTYQVTINFTAPADNFNAIGLNEFSPASNWTVTVNPSWCTPSPISSNAVNNNAQYMWVGPYPSGTAFTASYQVLVPSVATPGTYTFGVGTKPGITYKIGGGASTTDNFSGDSTVTIAGTKLDQTITFGALASRTYGDPPFTVSATASSGLPVSFAIQSGPATISGNTVTITGAGSVSVRASQAGNDTYNPAPNVDQSFTVNKANQTITFGALANKTFGEAPFSVNATASSGLPVSFAIASGPASISGNTVTITGAGTVTVRASQAGNTNFNAGTPVDQPFTVAKADQTITFGALAGKTTADPPFTVSASTSSGLPVNFSILSGPASISGNTVTLSGSTGTVTVRASQGGDTNYNAAPNIDQSFVVTQASASITLGSLDQTYDGTPKAVTYTTNPSGLSASITYNDSATAPTNAGAYTVVATITTPGYSGSANGTLNIAKADPVITWSNPVDITYPAPLSATQLNAACTLPGAFVYNPPSGTVLNVGAGQSLGTTFTPTDIANYNVATKSVSINVNKANQTITFNALSNKSTSDPPFAVSATASSTLPVSFSILSGPASISGNTITLSGSTGTVTIRASQGGNANYNAAPNVDQSFIVSQNQSNVTVSVNAPPSSAYNSDFTVNIDITQVNTFDADNFTVTFDPAVLRLDNVIAGSINGTPIPVDSFNQNSPGVYTIVENIPGVAGVSGAGTLAVLHYHVVGATGTSSAISLSNGILSDMLNQPISATWVDDSVTIAKAGQTITFGALSARTFGDAPFTVSATASSGLPVSFAIASGPATISGNTVTITGAGTVAVRASQAGDSNYDAALDVDQSFIVAKAGQTITFGALSAKAFGDVPFTVSATASSGLPVSFAIASGPATISGNTVTITGAGTVIVRASQGGNENYNAATPADQPFTVAKANQTITFGALANKTYGDAPFTVSATASSGLPVSFSIASGPATISGDTVTIIGAGAVTVRASQSGDSNYNAAPNVDQPFTVAKADQTITFAALSDKVFGVPDFPVNATASSGLPVTFIASGACQILSGNMVHLTGTGACTITAQHAGDANYNAAPDVLQSFNVTSTVGDANGDGLINASDITKVERIIVGLDTPTPGADANLDGSINALDITKVERIILQLP